MKNLLNNTTHIGERDLFGDPIIYRTSDKFGDILVIERAHIRSLTFDSVYDQSSMDVRTPDILVHEYTHAMVLSLAFCKSRHVTLLGLGAGCILRSIHKMYPEYKICAVELRQKVYDVAIKFFGLPVSKNIQIIISDAEQWLINAEDSSTDIIIADMFTAYCMNPLQVQINFITQCHRVLSKNGCLVINYHDISDFDDTFFEFVCSVFSDVFIYKTAVGNNNIVFASKGCINALPELTVAVSALEKKLSNRSINLFNRLTRVFGH